MLTALKKLMRLLTMGERLRLLGLVALFVLSAGLELVGLGLVPLFVGALVAPADSQLLAYLDRASLTQFTELRSPLVIGASLLVAVFAAKALFSALANASVAVFVRGVVNDLGARLFQRYLRAPFLFHIARNSAELLRNVMMEVSQLSGNVLTPLIGVIANSLLAVALLILVAIYLPGATLLWALLFIAVAGGLMASVQRYIKVMGHEIRSVRSQLLQTTTEAFQGYREIRLLRRGEFFEERFQQSLGAQTRIQETVRFLNRVMPSIIEFIAVTGVVIFTLYLAAQVSEPEELLPSLTAIIVVAARMKGVVATVLAQFAQLRHNLISVLIVDGDLRDCLADAEPSSTASAVPAEFHESIRLERVSFRYPGVDQPSLDQVDVQVNKGEMVGVVGSTGSGKTTLINLIMGFLRPQAGVIRVDGKDVGPEGLGRLRLGYVPQDIFMIDGSIRDNVTLGLAAHDVDGAQLAAVIRAAHLEEFVASLPQGLDTHVGEKGAKVSGGQRQRIGIARALYARPEILVLDEATAALDRATAQSVMDAIVALKRDHTIIVIAHRTENLKLCDSVVMLIQGRTVAQGPFNDLLAKSPDFAALMAPSNTASN